MEEPEQSEDLSQMVRAAKLLRYGAELLDADCVWLAEQCLDEASVLLGCAIQVRLGSDGTALEAVPVVRNHGQR